MKTRGRQKEAPDMGKRNNWMEMRREWNQWASLCLQHSCVIIPINFVTLLNSQSVAKLKLVKIRRLNCIYCC